MDLLDADYLFMYFNRPEFDRYSRFNSWGSARETFDWSEMCDIEIDLPPLDIQQKYDVYNAMLANQQSYERGLEDLETDCMRISKNCEETHLLLQSESTSCRQMKGIHLIFQPIQCVAYRYPRT